ncbi:MAG: glycosyltransferase family 39 protein [Bacteroidales bacterium]
MPKEHVAHIKATCKWDINPPGYLMILHGWIELFGTSETALRSLSLVSVSLAASLLFFICIRYLNTETAVYSSLFLLVSKSLFYYSLEARGYGLIFLMVVICLWLFFDLIKKPKTWTALLLGLLYGLLIYTHYLSAFFVIVQTLFLLIYNPQYFNKILYTIGGGVAVLFHWRKRIFDIFTKKTSSSNKSWIPEPQADDIPQAFYTFFNNEIVFWSLVVISVVSIIFVLYKSQMLKNNIQQLVFFSCIGFGIIVIFYLASQITPMWVTRYFLFSLIGMSLFFAYSTSLVPVSVYLKAIVILTITAYSFFSTTYTYKSRMNYKDAVTFMQDSLITSKQPYIIVQTTDVTPLFAYYYNREWFNDISHFRKHGENIHVFTMNTSKNIKKNTIESAQELFLVQTYHQFGDPKKTVQSYLDSVFQHKNVYKQFATVKITHYSQ